LGDKYSIDTSTANVQRDSSWYEWKFTQDEKSVYLLGKEVDARSVGGEVRGGMNDKAYCLLQRDLTTKDTHEILKMPKTRSLENSAWHRLVFSPDGQQILLLGFGETRSIYGYARKKIVTLRLVDLPTRETKIFAYRYSGKGTSVRNLAWLFDETVAVSLHEEDEFFFTDIETKIEKEKR
jgi:hypothetical protein